jgi:hypothetical protein
VETEKPIKEGRICLLQILVKDTKGEEKGNFEVKDGLEEEFHFVDPPFVSFQVLGLAPAANGSRLLHSMQVLRLGMC